MFRSTTVSALLILLAVSATTALAGPTWVKEFRGLTDCRDRIGGMELDSKGNLYVVGWTNSGSNSDIYLIKYDPAGNQPWGAPWIYDTGSGNHDYAYDIVVDSNDEMYVCGSRSSSNFTEESLLLMKFDESGGMYWMEDFKGWNVSGPGKKCIALDRSGDVYVAGELEVDPGEADFITMKYDSAGRRAWASLHNGPANDDDGPIAMASDHAGNVYITGLTASSQTGHDDILTLKYAPNGKQDWVALYDGPKDGKDSDEVRDITVDDKCNVYITGGTDTQDGTLDVITVKYNGAGEEAWVARYNGPFNSNDYGNALEVDAEGNVYVVATSRFDAVTWEIVVIKYNSSGSELWVRKYREVGEHNVPEAIALDGMGNIYVTAVVDDGIDRDILTLKYSPSGSLLWEDRYHSGPGNVDAPEQMLVDWDGDIYVIGTRHKIGNPFNVDCAIVVLKYQHSGLLGHWKMDDGSGNIANDSAGNLDASMVFHSPTSLGHWADGPEGWGGALQLDGTDYAVVPNHTTFDITDEITVAAWVKVDSFNSPWASFVSKGEFAWRLQRDGNNDIVEFSLGYWQDYGGVFGITPINDGRWHHLVGTTDGVWEYLYVDGRVDGSHRREAATPTAVQLSGEPVLIGSNPHFTDRRHVGLIDDVRIYNRALSDDEISRLYRKGDPKNAPSCTFLPQDFNKDGRVNFIDFARFAEVWLEETLL